MKRGFFFGEGIFADRNIFTYALARQHRHKRRCNDLLVRINQGDIAGFTSSTVINELFHTVFNSNMLIIAVNFEVLKKAIHAATCKIYAISNMATNDADFDRIEWIL